MSRRKKQNKKTSHRKVSGKSESSAEKLPVGRKNTNKQTSANKAVKNKRPISIKIYPKLSEESKPLGLSEPNVKKTSFKFKIIKYVAFIAVFCCVISIFVVVAPDFIDGGAKFEMEMGRMDEALLQAENKYSDKHPESWGEMLEGVINRFYTDKQEIALTLDACGGKHGSAVDEKLVDYLMENNIKATLFINFRWIEANKELFLKLASSELFEIENHGFHHSPLSVTPRKIYGIESTEGIPQAFYEVALGAFAIEKYTGRKPSFFRSGTAYYDDIALKMLDDMGYKAMAFSVNADEGATLPAEKVYKRMMGVKSGDIVIAHMNRPKGHTAEGIIKAIPELSSKGFKFITLSEAKDLKSEMPAEEQNLLLKGEKKLPPRSKSKKN